ncbi:hypothetical protein M436DRAFT_68349 [Aureobasidium namibiae CBS 147.97]|uniref:BZIP domain-containing protein n=1 Tax=Aureobasidium namibiae CBS 147.97 TaxID=1043004 RepID=A0A074X0S6_9PEZI
MEYQQPCVPTNVCHFPVYTMHDQQSMYTHPVWPGVSEFHYGYEQHTLTAPVGNTSTQNPVTSPGQIASTEQVVVNSPNRLVEKRQKQPLAYCNGIAVDCGRSKSPAIRFDFEGHLECAERRRGSAAEDESLTPTQRRRRAQNLAAQRAYRNRRRQREEELEAQLSASKVRNDSLESDIKRLKRELLLAQDENKILRSIVQTQPPSNALP